MIFLLILILIFLLIVAPRFFMVQGAKDRTYQADSVPSSRAAIVFGAGLNSDGTPTTVLRDRVETAVQLYQKGIIEKILMSGDNRFLDYNEPGAMKAYAVQLGIPADDLILDYAGRRTYDTCYRAKDIFLLSDAILVTQDFHLPRALFTCNSLGLKAWGVSADMRSYRDSDFWNIREIPASLIAFIQVYITQPEPVLGDQEPIFPLE